MTAVELDRLSWPEIKAELSSQGGVCPRCGAPLRFEPNVAERLIFDLGLVRNIGYYTGAVFDVYDPALGTPIGGGGRYDDLLGRFGRSMPAVGFALGVDRLHIALAGEERGTGISLAGRREEELGAQRAGAP